MKKCPTCEKTFDDSMRFCQSDGTPLVDATEPVDPYKTMVARPDEIAAAMPPSASQQEEKPIETAGRDDDVLQLPKESDPLKTMFASEEEIRREMRADRGQEEQVIEIPPLTESPSEPFQPGGSATPSAPPSPFGSHEPPPSPFAASESPASWQESTASSDTGGIGNLTTPPIPSPFGSSGPAQGEAVPPPSFKEPQPSYEPAAVNPFDQPSSPPAPQWTPPPVPQGGFAERGGSGMAAATPAASAVGGPSQGLAIASLVTGILSCFCCGWFIPGIAAVVMGYIARSKAIKDPSHYTGAGLALGGIISGLFSIVLGIIVIALYFFGFLAGIMNSAGY